MEKVVVVNGLRDLDSYDVIEVNEQLRDGWKVKSVTMDHADDYVNVVFVLEKE